MVCEKCTIKLSKLATIHTKSSNLPGTSSSKKITNENKLLSSKAKFKPKAEDYKRCRICRQLTHHVAAYYCQSCAYQKGICAMCGIKILETQFYRQSGV